MLQTGDLNLPDVQEIPLTGFSSYYGAIAVAAAYCKLSHTPEAMRGVWQHGWTPKHYQFHPIAIGSGVDVLQLKDEYYWVAREDEALYLQSYGCRNARAIGLPILYLPVRETLRRPKSLLVMPAHSLAYTRHDWKFDEYAEEIASIRKYFENVAVCVHPSCWKNGYWIDVFKKRDFKVVQGARVDDRNALERIYRLLSRFEYVTTNSLGSHVAYAAYLGAKVSIFGSYAEFKAADFINDPFYVKHPELVDPTIHAASEATARDNYPKLFCQPQEAEQRVDWGRSEVGFNNKQSPAKIKSLFGWGTSDRAISKIKATIPQRVKCWGRTMLQGATRK